MKGFILIVSLMVITSPINAINPVVKKKQELSKIQSIIQENKEKLVPKKEKKKSVEKKLFELRKELKYTDLKLKRTKKKLYRIQNKKKQTQKKIQKLSQKFQRNQKEFSERIVKFYKGDQLGVLTLLLSPDTMMALTEGAFYFEKILNHDIELINKMKKEFTILESQKQLLHTQTEKIAVLKGKVLQRQRTLKHKKKEKKAYIQKLTAQIKGIEERNQELERSSQKIEQLIKTLVKNNTKYFGTGKMKVPVKGWLSSRFGVRKHPIIKKWIRHNGIDIAARRGTRIYAADSGRVIFSGQKSLYRGYGKIIVIDHGKRQKDGRNISTFYAHASRVLVKRGQKVKKGDEIGWVGATGYATGPHLHFEVRENGKPVDPLTYIKL
jgi:murein DD-endopeptidase MepM/ murein hydrolase activator NlpD